ncbi:MAG: C-GCAxxG-C-C family protein [Lachnospiraceae bacterium]|nr:C-GCAxxG-C-C family protein [Lachnospiraceae bacterium]
MTIEERAQKGAEFKAKGMYNCTRSVLAAFDDVLDLDEAELTKLTAGFAAGMGNMEGDCGALIGAIMVAGMLTEGKATPRYSKVIFEKFNELSKAVKCKDLKGIGTGEVLCECPNCVANAIRALDYALELDGKLN